MLYQQLADLVLSPLITHMASRWVAQLWVMGPQAFSRGGTLLDMIILVVGFIIAPLGVIHGLIRFFI